MNTIDVKTFVGDGHGSPTTEYSYITYNEADVSDYIRKALLHVATKKANNDLKDKVRDFFSEGEWDDGDFSTNKKEINDLLASIDANKITSEYKATVTITASVWGYTAEDKDDAENMIEDGIQASIDNGTIEIEGIEISDLEVE